MGSLLHLMGKRIFDGTVYSSEGFCGLLPTTQRTHEGWGTESSAQHLNR
jgi:hypothetical protein